MPDILQTSVKNKLLSCLLEEDFAKLRPHLQSVALNFSEVLAEPEETISYVHFIESGVSSLIMMDESGKALGITVIGREGMSGVDLLHGLTRSSHQIVVQIAGSALRLPTGVLQTAMNNSPTLRASMLLFANNMFKQVMRSALVHGCYMIKQRLARLLLIYHDRINHDDLPLTHDFLSSMISTRRPSVTTALHELEVTGSISINRQLIHIRDRDRLIESTDGCYGALERQSVGISLRQCRNDIISERLMA